MSSGLRRQEAVHMPEILSDLGTELAELGVELCFDGPVTLDQMAAFLHRTLG